MGALDHKCEVVEVYDYVNGVLPQVLDESPHVLVEDERAGRLAKIECVGAQLHHLVEGLLPVCVRVRSRMKRDGNEGGRCWVLRTALLRYAAAVRSATLRAPAAEVSAESRSDASPLLRLQVAGKDVVSPVLERNDLSVWPACRQGQVKACVLSVLWCNAAVVVRCHEVARK